MLMNGIQAAIFYKRNSCNEPAIAKYIGRPAFDKEGELRRLSRTCGVATGAAFAPRLDFDARSHIKRSGSGRSIKRLVTWKCQHVDGGRLQINWHHAGRLSGIHQKKRIVLPADSTNLSNWLNRSKHIRNMQCCN